MKKTLIALAIGATVLTPVMANAADVQIYGRAHVSVDLLDDGKDYQEVGLSSNSSRLGFRANKDINENLNVFTEIEQEINYTQGDGAAWASRNVFVGLKGDFGQVRIGKFDTAFKEARNPINFFGDQLGDVRNLTRGAVYGSKPTATDPNAQGTNDNLRFDERNPNTIEYKSPKFGPGFVATVGYSLHEGAIAADSEKDQAYDLALGYKEGPIDFAIAYERYEQDANRGERDGIRLAAAYKVTPELNLAALYQLLKHDNDTVNPDAQVFGVAADYKVGPKTYVRGQYLLRDVDSSDANSSLIALGLEHRLDSALRVYANVATVLNDDNASLVPWKEARTNAVAGATGENSTGLSLGLRYDF